MTRHVIRPELCEPVSNWGMLGEPSPDRSALAKRKRMKLEPIDRIILEAASASRCLYRHQGKLKPRPAKLFCSFRIEDGERLVERGLLSWTQESRRSLVITDDGRQALEVRQ